MRNNRRPIAPQLARGAAQPCASEPGRSAPARSRRSLFNSTLAIPAGTKAGRSPFRQFIAAAPKLTRTVARSQRLNQASRSRSRLRTSGSRGTPLWLSVAPPAGDCHVRDQVAPGRPQNEGISREARRRLRAKN